MLRTFGSEAHEIWNVADPANPVLITRLAGLKDTHKSLWECDTGIAYLVSGAPDWRVRRMTQVYDLSDPAHPVKIRDFGLPGQEPGATGAVPTELHGTISTGPAGNRVYFGYGTDKGGMMQIVDREKLLNGPAAPTPENLRSRSRRGCTMYGLQWRAHDLPDAGDADRRIRQRQGGQHAATSSCSSTRRSRTSAASRGRWCGSPTSPSRTADDDLELHGAGGERQFLRARRRFGSHSSNESMDPVFYKKIAFITFFNAGVRALDVRDPVSSARRSAISSRRSPRRPTSAA